MLLLEAVSIWDVRGYIRCSVRLKMLRVVNVLMYASGLGVLVREVGISEGINFFHLVVAFMDGRGWG